jgi:hypothetical protein
MAEADWHIAQLNVGRIVAPTDSPQLADFMLALDRINALAEESPGFVWRLQGDSGNATEILTTPDPYFLINMSVWESIEGLFEFVYRSAHTGFMVRRREWFERPMEATRCCGGCRPAIFRRRKRRWLASTICGRMARHPTRSPSSSTIRRPTKPQCRPRT